MLVKMKTRRYAAPAVKGLNNYLQVYDNSINIIFKNISARGAIFDVRFWRQKWNPVLKGLPCSTCHGSCRLLERYLSRHKRNVKAKKNIKRTYWIFDVEEKMTLRSKICWEDSVVGHLVWCRRRWLADTVNLWGPAIFLYKRRKQRVFSI